MQNTYLLRSLKRVHDECERALRDENYKVNQSLSARFNEILRDFKEEYSDNEIIQGTTPSDGTSIRRPIPAVVTSAIDGIQEIKLKTLRIADSLELDTDDFEQLTQGGEFAVINVQQEQQQAQNQEQYQRITVEGLRQEVAGMMISPEDKEQLNELIETYDDELKSGDAEPRRLRGILDRVGEYSADVRRKLMMMAVERGVDILMNVG